MTKNYSERVLFDNRFRFWISTFVYLIAALDTFHDAVAKIIPLTALFFIYLILFGGTHWVARNRAASAGIDYFLAALDAVMITAAVALTGGIGSPLYILYLVTFGFCIYHEDMPKFAYSFILSLALYGGMLFYVKEISESYLYQVGAQLILLSVLTGVMYAILVRMKNEKEESDRLLSRSKALANISNILSSSLSNSRDWMKLITNLIDQEIKKDGLKCRIVIHKRNQPLLPPSGGKVGIQVPIMVGDYVFGTMMVTRETKKPLDMADQDFFSSVAQSLGISLHRAQIWEDFQKQLKLVEAKMLLDPQNEKVEKESKSRVSYMLEMVEDERAEWTVSQNICRLDDILKSVVGSLDHKIIDSDVDICVQGPVKEVPEFLADKVKLIKMTSFMIETAIGLNGMRQRIDVQVMLKNNELTVSVRGSKNGTALKAYSEEEEARAEKLFIADYDAKLGYCQRVSKAHKGRFWIKDSDGGKRKILGYSLPVEPVESPAASK